MNGDEYRAHLARRLIESGVPAHLHEGLIDYIAARRETGSFLRAVLSNDLKDAVLRADHISSEGLKSIVVFLCNYVTSTCWGSPLLVAAWLADPTPPREVYE